MSKNWGVEIEGGFFNEEHHIYRNIKGVIVPSPTQVNEIQGLSDFSMVSPEDLIWKRTYGLAVHKALEYLACGTLEWYLVDEAIYLPVKGLDQRLKDMKFEVEGVEERRIVSIHGMEYGMTSDLRGTIEFQNKRRAAIIDLKTGSKFAKYWEWQVGGYIYPQPKGTLGIILQVDPKGKVTPHYIKDPEAAKREFHVLLAASIVKLNNGYAQLKQAA